MENEENTYEYKNSRIADELYHKGFVVMDNYLDEAFRISLLHEQQDLLHHGQFRHAGIGKGESFAIRPEIRGDKVLWMDEAQLTTYQHQYWQIMDTLRQAVNRRCFLGLRSFECHFAMYPPGSFYLRHLDQFRAVAYRIVTVILYLNDSWTDEDGGALRMYLNSESGEETIEDILPIGGRLVAFLSGEIHHEVLPTRKERISITGWFRDIP